MNTEQETNIRMEENELNLGDILQTVLANWYWFVLSVVVCAGTAFLYLKWAPKVYTRTASVLIKDDAKGGAMSESAAFEDLGLFGSKRNVDNEVLVFKSRRLMTEVARNLHLDVSYTVKDGLRTVELYTQSPVQLSFPDAEEAQAFSLKAVPVSGKEVVLSGFTLGGREVADGKPVKVHLYDRPDYPELFVKVPAKATDYKDTFKNCKQMADYAMIPIAWGGVSDGTKAKPIIALSYALPENMEYHGINFTVKGTEFKSGKYIVGTTELVQSVLDEFDGDMEKATNKYGIGFTATQLETLMSDAGLQLPFNDLEPETEYMLLVRGQNVHGLTFETLTATTAVRPQGSADYERYIGTWTVTTTSSEVTGQPQTYTIRIEPYRNDKSYKVYDWGVTTLGSKEEDFPFILSYNEADGSVGINSYEDLGMYGFTYYIYLRYRFLNEQSQPSIWVSEDTLVSGAYDAASNEITITCGTFNDNSGITQKITGLDYVLYTGGKYYEAQNLIRPGYLIVI